MAWEKERVLKWLFLDLNSYFASVEQQENPRLRGKPVIVTPVNSDATCAIAASYEAKRYGIRTGTPVWEAKKKCPHLIMVNGRHNVYVDYHHRIIAEVDKHYPVEERDIFSIDEMGCRLTGRFQDEGQARALAHAIKEGICRNVGDCLTCSVGIAPNQLLAKMASDFQKPDGLTVWRPDDVPRVLYGLKLDDVTGIGRNMKMRLICKGVPSLRTFCELQPKQARRIWGSVEGERYWYLLHGYDVPRPPTHKSTIGHSHVLDPYLRDPDKARLVLRRLTMKAASRLRRSGYRTGRVAISIRFENYTRWADDIGIPHTDDSDMVLHAVDGLWAQMMHSVAYGRIKKVSVSFFDLLELTKVTGDLFQEQLSVSRPGKLSHILDGINKRFGKDTVYIGAIPGMKTRQQHAPPQPMGDYSGVKIAFGRIPEQAEFWE